MVVATGIEPWPGWADHLSSVNSAAGYYTLMKKYKEKNSEMVSTTRALTLMSGMTFGCDPELFIKDKDGRLVCADGLLPGTKAEPYKVDGGAIQVDGFAAEINTDPAKTFKEFNLNMDKVLGRLKQMLPKGYSFHDRTVATFDEDIWDAAPEHSKELGCSPDFNAWTGSVNSPPDASIVPRFRTAAGHVHLGWTEGAQPDDVQHVVNCRDVVKQLDLFLGAWAVPKEGTDGLNRRALYGKAGACRIKPYGVEYRVLGNFWVLDKDSRLEVWNRTCRALDCMAKNFVPDAVQAFGFNSSLQNYIEGGPTKNNFESVFTFPLKTIDPRMRNY